MAAIHRLQLLKNCFGSNLSSKHHKILGCVCLSRSMAYWNKDWKPGPYPKTEAERVAAAKKYGLLREDYEPYPDDGFGLGDYPKLAPIGADSKDPSYPYDYPAFRRNYGEPMEIDFHMHGEDKFDPMQKLPWSYWQMAVIYLSVVTSFAILIVIADTLTPPRPVMAKQLPAPGVVHYNFNPAK